MRRLPGCGCLGCAGLLLVTGFVLAGAIGVLAGDHAALAHPPTRVTSALPTVWPLDGPITQRFGPNESELQPPLWYRGTWYEHFHAGLDIGASLGSDVVALAAGVVTFADRIADGAVVVEVTHAPGVTSSYAHLAARLAVHVGQPVATGDVLGQVGLTGITTGPHLHLAVWSGGDPLDPLTVLPRRIEPERAGGR